MATEAKNTNYWISSTALYIQLNSMGEPDYIQCSVVSGASVLCYMSDVPGLGYDAGHNYQRWTLAAYPSIFPDSERKYVYIAIPRQSTTDNNQATVVFPGEKIDIYGKTIPSSGTEGVQIGNEAYYYIFTGGIISAVKTDADNTRKREWEQHFDCGKLATDEAIASGGEGAWWRYNSVSDTITFLKEILKANFNELSAKVARVTSLFLGGHELKGVADSNGTLETSNDTVVTPQYLGQFGVKHFLAKDKDDTAYGTITWEKVQKFFSGLLIGNSNNENGGSWTTDAEGRSHLITDYLEVRMKAIFEELVINKTSTIGGKEIISPAGGVVAHKVEEVTVTYNNVSQKAYRCYFLAEQEGDAVDNDFAVNDQVRSESFNVRKGTYHKAGNHFYWRLVIGRDEDPVELEGKKYHYIDLSDTDCATASDVPAKGDVLNQCGNRTDVERQNCLIFSAVDTYSPSISLYHGINSYSFANREYVKYGVNKQTNKAFFNVYGDMYVGDRPTKENGYEGSSYVKYDSATKQVVIKGKLSAKSTVDGKELSQYIKENSAKGLTEEQVNNLIKNSQVIADLQNQVDGAIETWFYEGVPTLENAPAISWKTDKDKEIHLGDLYYDNKTGKAYRFAQDSNTYKWTIITDTDIAKALSDARMAQETANGKMKVFSVQPTTPYQVGDIWVNATYPSDGSTYKNEVLRCQTNKAAGSQFAIGDWIKASKYTDDTVANAAKKAAEDAQKAAQTAQTDIKNLGKTVTDNKKEFDNYVTDGYLEPSEIAAMAQDSKRLEDDFAAAQKSYNEVKDAEVLKDTKELTDLNTAFATLTSAKTELIKFLSDISKRYNETDTDGKAAIVSAVGTKFTNFQSAYSAFYDKLGLANSYITRKIYGDLKQNITDLAGYKYLKDALGQTTDIDGGLVMTTLLALRDGDGNVQSGINGAIDPNRGKKSIATWWGGQMVDKDYNSGNLTPATSLIRFDGSGYLANGAIWWDVSGKVHADPTSFIISEKNLGAYLIFFEPTWKAGSAGTSVADLVSLKPNAPFSKLGVSGDATFEGAISFHGIKLTYDSTNKAIKIDGNLYATGGITAYGAGASTTGGGGGLNGSVKSYSSALKLTSESLSEIASAYSIKALDSRISSLEGGSAMNVSVSGSGNAVTAISKSGTTIIVTKGTTFLTSHQSLASYLTRTDAASLYQPKGNYLTSHQSLANYYTKSSVDSLLSGKSANSHTHSVKINGVTKTIAATGGTAVDLGTYLTSHQSLADYAKKSEIPTKVSQLTNDTGYITSSGSCAYATSAGNADKVDGIHANGLLTALSNSDKGISITVGGTTKSISNIGVNYASSAGNADTVDGEHASAFTRIVGRYGLYTSGTAPYKYIHLFRIANSNGYSTLDCEIDIRTRYHSAKIEIRITTARDPYNNGGSSISIVKKVVSGRTCNLWFLLTVQSSNYNYYDVYYESGAWNQGSYGITLKGLNGNLVFEHKGTHLTSLPDKVVPVSNNVATSATKLQTPRTIWGQSFDGTGNVNGSLSGVGHIQFSADNSYSIGTTTSEAAHTYTRQVWARHLNASRVYAGDTNLYIGYSNTAQVRFFSGTKQSGDGSNERMTISTNGNVGIGTAVPAYKLHVVGDIYSKESIRTAAQNQAIKLSNDANPAWISALDGQVIFNTGKAIRFGETAWDLNKWAGLKYTHSNKTIYLGIADGNVFNANSAQSNGTLRLACITTITPDSGARIGGSGGDLYLGNANNSNLVKVQDICSQNGSIYWYIYQSGNAHFSNINVTGTTTIGGNTTIDGNTTIGGNCFAKGGVTAYQSSDIRLKQDLRKLDYLGIIKAMGGTFGFAWKKDNTRSIGWIAQHVLCNPHLKDIVETDEKGYYKINYWSPKLIATAFGAIEQVGDEVSRLKARVVFLESEVQRLSGDKDDCNKKRLDNKNINSLN